MTAQQLLAWVEERDRNANEFRAEITQSVSKMIHETKWKAKEHPELHYIFKSELYIPMRYVRSYKYGHHIYFRFNVQNIRILKKHYMLYLSKLQKARRIVLSIERLFTYENQDWFFLNDFDLIVRIIGDEIIYWVEDPDIQSINLTIGV
jgi:hypothetical protein